MQVAQFQTFSSVWRLDSLCAVIQLVAGRACFCGSSCLPYVLVHGGWQPLHYIRLIFWNFELLPSLFFGSLRVSFWCWGWCSIRGATSDVRREIVLTNPCQMTDRQNGYRDADDICCVEKLPMPKNDVEWWLPKASWFMLSFRINDAGRCWKLYKVKSFDVKIENTLCTWPIKS